MDRVTAFTIVEKYIKSPNLINHMLLLKLQCVYTQRNSIRMKSFGVLPVYCMTLIGKYTQLRKNTRLWVNLSSENMTLPTSLLMQFFHMAIIRVYPRTTLLDKGLFACDEITGLITAVALVRPSKSLYDLNVKSVKKKWKDKSFAAGANREEITKGAQEFGVELWEHTENVILAMKGIAPQIGLAGNLSPE